MTLAKLIGSSPAITGPTRREGRMTEIVAAVRASLADVPGDYERQVFSLLHRSKQQLGIKTIWRCHNHLIDGALVLRDGQFIPFEVKYRMNWLKACQAEWQLRRFARSQEGHKSRPRHGIVFFEAFSGDWAAVTRGLERGWMHWYEMHAPRDVKGGVGLSLLRLAGGRLSTIPVRKNLP